MELLEHVPLAPLTTIGVGGPARWFVSAPDLETLRSALRWAERERVPVALLGGGSNLLVADAGFPGLVIALGLRGLTQEGAGDEVRVTAAAGEPWDALVAETVARDLVGLECLSGIPGHAGATPVQNVGAYGREVSELVTGVRVLDLSDGTVKELGPRDCRFGYRDSWFKGEARGRYAVVSVTFRLAAGRAPIVRYPELAKALAARGLTAPTAAEVREVVLEIRRAKSMVLAPGDPDARSCGSFFVNPVLSVAEADAAAARSPDAPPPRYAQADGRVKLPAAWLIEGAGFVRGTRDGNVGLSRHHALAIVARDGATAAEVVRFAGRVRQAVLARFGIRLDPEPVTWGFERTEAGLPSGGSSPPT